MRERGAIQGLLSVVKNKRSQPGCAETASHEQTTTGTTRHAGRWDIAAAPAQSTTPYLALLDERDEIGAAALPAHHKSKSKTSD
jgi:hypothetical protein